MTVATIAGEAGRVVAELFLKWQATPTSGGQDLVRNAVDLLARQLRARGGLPPILYYCEWFDCWSMGDTLHLGKVVEGKRMEASCGSLFEAAAWAKQCGNQFPEDQWLASRLREASEAGQWPSVRASIVILREVLGPSVTDEEVRASLSDTGIFSNMTPNEI
jgi:hypothetical protein